MTVSRKDSISESSFERCDRFARSWEIVSEGEARACEELFPDTFVAEETTKRKVHLWCVEYTLSEQFRRFRYWLQSS